MNIEMFFAMNANKLPSSKVLLINDKLKNMSEQNQLILQSVELKNPTTFLLLYLFCPLFCLIDRFFTGQSVSAVFKILTLGGIGIWTFIDIFTIQKRIREHNFNEISKYLI